MPIDHRLLAGLLLGAASCVHGGAHAGADTGAADTRVSGTPAQRLAGRAAHASHHHPRHAGALEPAGRDWASDGMVDAAVADALGDALGDDVHPGGSDAAADRLGAALPYGFGGLRATPLFIAPVATSALPDRFDTVRPVVPRPTALVDGEWVWRGPKGGFVRKLDDNWHLSFHYTRALGLVEEDDRVAASALRTGPRPGFLDARRRALVLSMGHSF